MERFSAEVQPRLASDSATSLELGYFTETKLTAAGFTHRQPLLAERNIDTLLQGG